MSLDFLQSTAWQMEQFKPYGAMHLCFFFAGLTLSVALAYLLRNTTERQNKIFLFSLGVYMALAETYKQFFYYCIVDGGKYNWYEFPFHLCSVPIYFCLLLPWLKEGKVKDAMYDFLLAFNLFSGFIAFAEPSGLNHTYVTMTAHSLTWHMLLVFLGLYLGFSGRACKSLKGYRGASAVFVCLCGIAFCLNLIFYKASNGTINAFFIGPANSPLIVFKDICQKYGWYVNLPIYIFGLLLGSSVFYYGFYFAKKAPTSPRRRKVKA